MSHINHHIRLRRPYICCDVDIRVVWQWERIDEEGTGRRDYRGITLECDGDTLAWAVLRRGHSIDGPHFKWDVTGIGMGDPPEQWEQQKWSGYVRLDRLTERLPISQATAHVIARAIRSACELLNYAAHSKMAAMCIDEALAEAVSRIDVQQLHVDPLAGTFTAYIRIAGIDATHALALQWDGRGDAEQASNWHVMRAAGAAESDQNLKEWAAEHGISLRRSDMESLAAAVRDFEQAVASAVRHTSNIVRKVYQDSLKGRV